jgi:putative addiction module component (TIGR02574 family)
MSLCLWIETTDFLLLSKQHEDAKMKESTLREIFELPVVDRIRLAQEILETVADEMDPDISDEEKAILDECIAHDEANPDKRITWAELDAELKRSIKRVRSKSISLETQASR